METHAIFRLKSIRCIARGTGVKSWKIIADNLSKADWSWGGSQPWIQTDERSGLRTRTAMESGSLCVPMRR
jgi:hypothetical protein